MGVDLRQLPGKADRQPLLQTKYKDLHLASGRICCRADRV